ncbi:ABC transporter substrate-binding protein [Kitasatospora sp. NPDC096147]|uniref:ABC transporter substrate-binding protein n=1 Tax=Kitasatospora sp. NPDC096147 TaxID=3364093 RepID=UPI00381E332D
MEFARADAVRAGLSGLSGPGSKAGPKVALVLPATGPRAAWGRTLRAVARGGTGPAIEWVLHDESAALDGARRVARKVVESGGYRAVVGHLGSRGAAAALPLYRAAGLPCLLPVTALPGEGLGAVGGLLPGAGSGSGAGGGGGADGQSLALSWAPDEAGQAKALLAALDSLGTSGVGVLTDGSAYGYRLGVHLLGADEPGRPVRPVGPVGPVPTALRTVVVAARFHKAAELARGLRESGYTGQLAFPDDCELAEFARLAGTAAAGALLCRPAGGRAPRVRAALAALAGALTDRPGVTGVELAAAVRERSALLLDTAGAPVADSWQVVRMTGA